MPESGWTLIDHVCRTCFGRLLKRGEEVRCADCETTVHGSHTALCACGARLKSGRNAGLRCRRNAQPTAEQPAAVVVVYVEVEDKACRG
jgi:hypothetical protein